jgi:hydroxymethylbilane synthase
MTKRHRLIVGTRGSALAVWQADFVRRRLADVGVADVNVEIIKTRGDRETSLPFDRMQGQGFFTKEIEQALLEGTIDLAVHSHKDLETTLPDGLQIAAVPQRMDRREMILFRPEAADPNMKLGIRKSAVVGTSSIRRVAQLMNHRPDLRIAPLRGNVPTRVEKLRRGEYDAILLAAAGIRRLNLDLTGLEAVELDERVFLPPPAQGALAVETRAGDEQTNALISKIDDPQLREIVGLEREVLRRMGGGCHLPLGVAADRLANGFRLSVFLGRKQGDHWDRPIRISVISRTPEEAVDTVVGRLVADHGVLENRRLNGRKILITRAAAETKDFRDAIEDAGGELLAFPTLKIIPAGNSTAQEETIRRLDEYDWVIFSSGIGIRKFFELLDRSDCQLGGSIHAAVMGPGSGAIFERNAGRPPDFIPAVSSGEGFVEEFSRRSRGQKLRILFPTTEERRGALENGLSHAGHTVEAMVVYNTVCPEPDEVPVWDGQADAVILTSPKAARFFMKLAEIPAGAAVISIGPATTTFLVDRQVLPIYEAIDHDLSGIREVLDVLFG